MFAPRRSLNKCAFKPIHCDFWPISRKRPDPRLMQTRLRMRGLEIGGGRASAELAEQACTGFGPDDTKSQLFGANRHIASQGATVTCRDTSSFGDRSVFRTTRYVACTAMVIAALAAACAEPTSPHQDSPCGGGTNSWDRCGTTVPVVPTTAAPTYTANPASDSTGTAPDSTKAKTKTP